MEKKRPLVILAGPTAVGKTSVSVELAKALNGECISADSVQVYRGWTLAPLRSRRRKCRGFPTT